MMFRYVKNLWLALSIKNKLELIAAVVVLVMGFSVAFNIHLMNFVLGNFNVILDDNSRCHDFQEAMDLESNLFRYNLKTTEQIVPLSQELKIVNDYMYIQQMRFGGRIRFGTSLEVEPGKVFVPAFTMQPLVENAIIHGLSSKEQGGLIHLRIWKKNRNLMISIADTGIGMEEKSRKSWRKR